MNFALRILLVAASGAVGAACRYVIMHYMKVQNAMMGLDTLVINTAGCLLIGFFAGWMTGTSWSQETKTVFTLLTMTGFCGGFSTFSAFTLDCMKYYESGHLMTWVVLGTLTVFGGLFACALGYWIGRQI